jgi:excisionase family DNA binding protein
VGGGEPPEPKPPAVVACSGMSADGGTPGLIPTREAAARLGVSVDTVRRAVADGRLPAVRLRERGWLRFRSADLDRLVSGEAEFAAEVDRLLIEGVLVERREA